MCDCKIKVVRFSIPGVAGFLVSSTNSYAWPFRIDAISFLILAAAIVALRINRKPQPHEEGEKMRALDGLKIHHVG